MLKHKTKKIGIALLISVMVFALCACGNTESEGSSEQLSVHTAGASYILDPQMTSNFGDWQYVNQIYDTIVTTDFDGKTTRMRWQKLGGFEMVKFIPSI